MAKVDKIRPEVIEQFRGLIDFYQDKRTGPIARAWPKKPKPPYTVLQAEAMAVFAIANTSMHRLSTHMLEVWQASTFGIRPSWTDVYRSIIMKYWKLHRSIAIIALDFQVIDAGENFKIVWDLLQLYIDPETPEELFQKETNLINKEDILEAPKPIYFTLLDDEGSRLVAPYILFEDKP